MKSAERTLPYWIIGLALVLRIYAAVSHLDISHPDEHFQTLEPAAHVVYGFGWLSWEWTEGLRSWFVPALYMPVLELCKWLGFKGGPVPIVACRVLMAAVSTAAVYEFWVLLRESSLKRGASLLALAVFALSPALSAVGAMTLSDVWAMVLLWCAFPFVLRSIEGERQGVIAGILLGLSFLARIQMILFAVGIGLVLLGRGLFKKPVPWKILLQLALGYCVVVLFQGGLDWATWGSPFHSIVMNIRKNLLENVAAFYGTAPFYQYMINIPAILGWPIVIGAGLATATALTTGRGKLHERDLLIAVPALLYLVVHSAIAHKEARFMYPVIPAVLYFLAWGVSAFERNFKLREDLAAFVTLSAAIVSSGFVYSTSHTYPFDLSELTLAIREDGGLANGGCLLLVDHYWIWTRGELMIGAPMRYIEASSRQPFPQAAKDCEYAITLPGREAWFNRPGEPHWSVLRVDSHGQILLKRDGLTKS